MIVSWPLWANSVYNRSVAYLPCEFDRIFLEVTLPVHGVVFAEDDILSLSDESVVDVYSAVRRLVLVFGKLTAANEHNCVDVVVWVTGVERSAHKLNFLLQFSADDLTGQPFTRVVGVFINRPAIERLVGVYLQLDGVSNIIATESLDAVLSMRVIQLQGEEGVHDPFVALQTRDSVEIVLNLLP